MVRQVVQSTSTATPGDLGSIPAQTAHATRLGDKVQVSVSYPDEEMQVLRF